MWCCMLICDCDRGGGERGGGGRSLLASISSVKVISLHAHIHRHMYSHSPPPHSSSFTLLPPTYPPPIPSDILLSHAISNPSGGRVIFEMNYTNKGAAPTAGINRMIRKSNQACIRFIGTKRQFSLERTHTRNKKKEKGE